MRTVPTTLAVAAVAAHGAGVVPGLTWHLVSDAVTPTYARQAVLLAYYEGLTHEELAARLSRPLGTVKTWVRRSLQQLKSCLEGDERPAAPKGLA